MKKIILSGFITLCIMLIASEASATHYRYGNITWTRDAINPLKVHFKVTTAYRRGYPWASLGNGNVNNPVTGDVIWSGFYFTPDATNPGNITPIIFTVTSYSAAEDWIYGEFFYDYTYPGNGSYLAYFEGAARISGPPTTPAGPLQNNGDGSFRVEAGVTVGNNNDAPVSSLPPYINMVIGNPGAQYQIPATDPNGDALTFSLASPASFYGVQPLGFNVSPSGLITFNTTNVFPPVKAIGQLYNGVVRVTDSKGAFATLDFLIRLTGPSSPPVYDYSVGVTPANNTTFTRTPGQNLNFQVSASDPDVGDAVTLFGNGIPVGSTTSPAIPFTGPVNGSAITTFNWTPTLGQVGTYVMTFIAQDPQGVQTPTTVNVTVACNTAFSKTQNAPSCPAGNDGSITITVTSGTGPFQYSKDNGATYSAPTGSPFTFNDLPGGTYNLKVKEANGCIALGSETLTGIDNTPPIISCPDPISVGSDPGQCGARVCYSTPVISENCKPAVPNAYVFLTSFGNSSYYRSAFQSDYPTAENNAKNAGGHLAVITSAAENNAITASGVGFSWIGGNDLETDGVWKWVTCEPTTFIVYCSGEPNGGTFENYLEFETGGCWNDLFAGAFRFSILEIEGAKLEQTAGLPQNALFPIGTTTNTFVATDASGNSSTCSFTVTVADDIAPTVTNCTGSTQSADANCLFNGSGGTFCIADNCSGDLTLKEEYYDQNNNKFQPDLFFTLAQNCYSLGANRGFPIGNNTVVLTVTDGAGNTSVSCSFNVLVVDDQSPVITCPATTTRGTDPGTCTYKVQGNEFDATATDCSTVTFTYNLSGATTGSGSSLADELLNEGTTDVTWTASDGINPSVSCTFSVTVNDIEPPTAKCKNATVTLVNGTASITAADVNDGSTDNCGVQSVTIPPTTFTCANIGNNTVTLTVTDVNGNTQTCTATVTVVGAIPSCTITAIPSNNVYTGGVATKYLGYGPQSVTLQTNASGGSPFGYSWTGTGTLSCTNCAAPVFAPTTAGSYTFTVTVTNQYGCKTTCSITICVTDIRVPGSNGKKVYVCHIPPGNPPKPQTVSVSVNGVPAHIPGDQKHVLDRLGRCDQVPCTAARPDNPAMEITRSFEMSVLPNPANGKFTVELNHLNGKAELTIVDLNGATIEKRSIEASSENLTIPFNLKNASGLYFIKLSDATGVHTEKVIIQR